MEQEQDPEQEQEVSSRTTFDQKVHARDAAFAQ